MVSYRLESNGCFKVNFATDIQLIPVRKIGLTIKGFSYIIFATDIQPITARKITFITKAYWEAYYYHKYPMGLADLQVKMSRSCRFLLFLPHKYQVTLRAITLWVSSIFFSSKIIFSSLAELGQKIKIFVFFFLKIGQKPTRVFMRNKDITWSGLTLTVESCSFYC